MKCPNTLAYIIPLLGALGCNNLIPGPYLEPPLPDGGDDTGDMPQRERPRHLVIDPSLPQQLTVTNGVPATFTWKAILHYDDSGEEMNVSDTCFWSVVGRDGQRTPLGSIDRGRFTSTPLSAGAGKVRADIAGLRVESNLSIKLTAVRLSTDDDGSSPPADPTTRFTGTANAAKNPILIYPPNGAVLPTSLGGLLVQFVAQGGTDLHEVRLLADLLDFRIYTTSRQRLTLSEADFNLLSDAGLYGPNPVSITVRGGNVSGDSTVGTSATVTLRAATGPSGATYYFATARSGGAQGIWRYGWGSGYGTAATAHLTTQSTITGGACVGCHSLSGDGGFLVVSHDQTTLATGSFLDLKTGMKRSVSSSLKWFSSALSPTGSDAYLAGGGALTPVQTQAGFGGTPLQTVTGNTRVVMPTLAPDGKRMVFVRGQMVGALGEAHISNGSLVLLDQQGGNFGSPADLLTASGNDNYYYPALSPDGKWVLFNRTSAAPAAADSYDNLTAALYAMSVDRSIGPVRLGQANDAFFAQQSPVNTSIASNLSNSFPTFLPGAGVLDGHQVFFFVFASRRNYGGEVVRTGTNARSTTVGATVVRGKITPGGDTPLAGWNQQLWISVFDPTKAAAGVDPSSPAVWLPAQSPLSSNHTPQSTQSLVGPAF